MGMMGLNLLLLVLALLTLSLLLMDRIYRSLTSLLIQIPMAQHTSAQHDTFASASSSSCPASTSHGPYHVFINHRGTDVKNTFATYLYRALKSRGLQVFLDRPELEPGHIILHQIEAAIQNASVHVAIFSPAYAESKWCLDELVLMLASSRTILPVFYGVKPSDLRWPDKGAYAEALQQHEKKKRYDLEKIGEWKRTLSHFADISGFELEACNGDEVDLSDKVVQRILKEVPTPPLYVAKYKIGLQEKLEEFESAVLSQLVEEQRREAKLVGVVGSGGIGKSTLAREFFNRKRSNYNVSSFLSDVREKAATKSLTSLQSQLIKDLKDQDKQIQSWEQGVGILEMNLKSCVALIILDDVDHRNQLNAFLPVKHVLHPDSLILVTSRDKQVLLSEGIGESSIYQLRGLERPNSLELFCWHAFFQPQPLPQFVDLVDGFVEGCDGLPLLLEVFGALLCGENEKSNWKERLNGLQELPREIQERLRISYDSLETEEQQIFLDIACFSIGQDKNKWIRIWSGSGWKGSTGLRNLENKCLVEVCQNKIRMHDHLRDLGRNISQEQSMPRRLWNATIDEVFDMLDKASSATIVRGIKMAPQDTLSDTSEGVSFGDDVFRISKLQLLEAEGDFVESILRKVRSRNLNLISLCWTKCPCSDLPSWIPMHDLRVLKVRGGNLKRLWQRESPVGRCIAPLKLQELNIVGASLLEIPNSIEYSTNLQEINLSDCESLEVLPDAFRTLANLQMISLQFCKSLKMLPNSIEYLTNLQEIDLSYSLSLEVLPDAFRTLANLKEIKLRVCRRLKTLPNSIEYLKNLQEINLDYCESLEVLPDAFRTLTNLQKISLLCCKRLKMLPDSIEYLTNLQEIDLSQCESLEVLPDAFRTLANLQKISLRDCRRLKTLPNSIESLNNLRVIDLRDCVSLEVLPDAFRTLANLKEIKLRVCRRLKTLPNSIKYLTNLQEIDLTYCESLEVLPDAFRTLTNLQKISLLYCRRLKTLPNSIKYLTNLQEIDLYRCESLEVLPDAFRTLANLQKISLRDCGRLKTLPNSIESLNNLRVIDLRDCVSLETLPNNFSNLMNLESINTSGSFNLQMPSNLLGNLLQLRHLYLSCCCKLIISNETLGNITTLELLDLSGCHQLEVLPLQVLHQRSLRMLNLLKTNIKELPSAPMVCLSHLKFLSLGSPLLKVLPPWLGQLTRLEILQLHGCPKLKYLPNSVGQLSWLKELHISKCGIQYLPADVMKMNNLETLRVLDCPLRELPFKKVEGEGEASLLTECSLAGREVDSSIDRGMIDLKELFLYLTEISEVSFPEGVCPNLEELKIRWCNNMVEAGALPPTLRKLDLGGCGALRKIGGLWGLANLEELDIRGCCTLQVEEVPGHESVTSLEVLRTTLRSLNVLKTPFETYDTNEKDKEVEMIYYFLDRGDSKLRFSVDFCDCLW